MSKLSISDMTSALNRTYYVVGMHPSVPGRYCMMRAWLTLTYTKRLVWVTRYVGENWPTEEEAARECTARNLTLDQPTFEDLNNGSCLTLAQVRILEGYKQIDRRHLRWEGRIIHYGKGKRKGR